MKYFKIFLCILSVIILISIFKFSSQPAYISRNLSLNTTRKIVEVLPQSKNLTSVQKADIAFSLDSTIRKYAHFFLYFCLGMFVVSFLIIGNRRLLKAFFLAVLICLLYAVSDEVHQIFVPGRGCAFRDVMIDLSGSMLGSMLIVGITKLKRKNIKSLNKA